MPSTQQYEVQPAQFERHESTYGNWMAPAAGGAVGGAALGALANEAHQRKEMAHQQQMAQRELAEQQELNQQAQDPRYPVEQFPPPTSSVINAAPAVPERNPDHHAPVSFADVNEPGIHPTLIPAPVMAAGSSREPTASHLDNTNVASPSTTTSFLDDSEVGAAVPASGKTVNGGPVPQALVDVAEAQAHPGMHRTNTDISVSDLHVPGEYPKAAEGGAKVPAAVTEETMIQM
jgi:hypothetical protein